MNPVTTIKNSIVLNQTFELTGRLVYSKAGRDKGYAYLLAGKSLDGCYLLIDGRIRDLDKPKKKNPRHVQLTNRKDIKIAAELKAGKIPENTVIRQTIKRMLEMKD